MKKILKLRKKYENVKKNMKISYDKYFIADNFVTINGKRNSSTNQNCD